MQRATVVETLLKVIVLPVVCCIYFFRQVTSAENLTIEFFNR